MKDDPKELLASVHHPLLLVEELASAVSVAVFLILLLRHIVAIKVGLSCKLRCASPRTLDRTTYD